ncbi:hypothetical protein E3U55_14510 [Filobacillus milosensis]|uniref:ABC transporter permease n=1 Tax=Filobacillus milosensis TaxID=94137 RepID=A0A4Y8IHE9_9BACI|nr:hypothetical protein [Filobacillus milosensis]TFB14123.1 hypothetical protein E3U55_14510 [Filobacillus milosensis]
MLWKYMLFELKVLMTNKKHLFIALILVLFFPLFFIQQSTTLTETLKEEKYEMRGIYDSIINQLPDMEEDTEKGRQVHESVLRQLRHVGMQIWYINRDREAYIEEGYKLIEEKRFVHELDNENIPEHFIFPKSEITKDYKRLEYIDQNGLPVEQKNQTTSAFLVTALSTLAGLLFSVAILISGNEILTFEKEHSTVMSGLPIDFFKKILVKISIHCSYIMLALTLGIGVGGLIAYVKNGLGYFNYPIIYYNNGSYEAIPNYQFLLLMFLGLAALTLLLLVFSVVLNLLFNHAFANLLIGLSILLLPELFASKLIELPFLQPLTYIHLDDIFTGEFSTQLNQPQLDYWNAILWFVGLSFGLLIIIYFIRKLNFYNVKTLLRPLSRNKV